MLLAVVPLIITIWPLTSLGLDLDATSGPKLDLGAFDAAKVDSFEKEWSELPPDEQVLLLQRLGKLTLFMRLYRAWVPAPSTGKAGFDRLFPQPEPPFHQNIYENCAHSIQECINFIYTGLENRLPNLFMKSAENVHATIAEDEVLPLINPNLQSLDITVAYLFCFLTHHRARFMARLPYCSYGPEPWANHVFPAGRYAENRYRPEIKGPNPEVLDQLFDQTEFHCAKRSFCPEPCCGHHDLNATCSHPICKNANPDSECRLWPAFNRDLAGMVTNRWNISCECPKAGFVFRDDTETCVDVDECVYEKCSGGYPNMHRRSREPSQVRSETGQTVDEALRNPRKKWSSALKVVHAMTRLRRLPSNPRQHQDQTQLPYDAREDEEQVVDPIYLALKEATGKYGSRRGSANQFDSATPSPQHLSQVSLQDSGYAEASGSRSRLLGSTPQLHQSSQPPQGSAAAAVGVVRPRAPKLNKQMKSLSLDCAEMPPPVSSTMRPQFTMGPDTKTGRQARGSMTSGETSDWERSVSPHVPSPRRLPPAPVQSSAQSGSKESLAYPGTHIVTHDYVPPGCADPNGGLYIGDRLHIVDNGDPDWLHGFRVKDRLQQLLTFPATCVAAIQPNEQPMRLVQNVHLAEAKLRLYRDQVVFAQPDSIRDQKVLVRNARGTKVYCPVQFLMLL